MHEPPNTNRHCHQQQAKNLVTPENTSLLFACGLLGLLFEMRLDAESSHLRLLRMLHVYISES